MAMTGRCTDLVRVVWCEWCADLAQAACIGDEHATHVEGAILARVAQEAEQGTCNAQAVGSTPTSGSGDRASCGHPNPVWFTDSHLWNEVMTGSRDGESSAILCPACFARQADRHFTETPGNWRILGWRMAPDWSRVS